MYYCLHMVECQKRFGHSVMTPQSCAPLASSLVRTCLLRAFLLQKKRTFSWWTTLNLRKFLVYLVLIFHFPYFGFIAFGQSCPE